MTAHDARPVAWLLRIGDSNIWTYCGEDGSDADFYGQQSGLPYEKKALYTATDYDALRAEAERLRDWRRELCERLGFDCAAGADWDAIDIANTQFEQLRRAFVDKERHMKRAEAAEARVARLSEVCELVKRCIENKHIKCPLIISPTRQAESLYDILTAALNDQGQDNG